MNTITTHITQDTTQEHLKSYTAARTSVAWRDCSAMGKLLVRGADRLDLLQRMTTNEMSKLTGSETSGDGTQTVFVTEKARIVDVATVLARADDALMLLSEGLEERVAAWLDKYTFMEDFRTENVTERLAAVMVLGPRAAQFLSDWAGANESSNELPRLLSLRTFHWQQFTVSSANPIPITLVKMPPLCESCYVLLFPHESKEAVFAALRSFGDDVPQLPDDVFETLRIEAGLGRIGTEWTDAHNPLEAALVTAVSFTKGCYIGQEVIARLDTYNKVKVRLMGFKAQSAGAEIPAGAKFFDDKGAEIGYITSATFSPELGAHIALGYIRNAYANPTTSAEAVSGEAGENKHAVDIVKLPFLM